jgi:ELWxxDGT repeat protein
MKRITAATTVVLLTAVLAGVQAPAEAAVPRTPFGSQAYLVKDLNPGPGDANIQSNRSVRLGDKYVFSALLSVGHEILVSDGTETGTKVLKDVLLPAQQANPESLLAHRGRVYYSAADETGDRELWATDGTPAGTQRVKDLVGGASSNPRNLTAFGTRFVFDVTVSPGVHQLWVSDGTPAGTHTAGSPVSLQMINGIQVLGSKVLFAGVDAENGWEPWVWGGTSVEPALLKDLNPSTGGSSFLDSPGTVFNGRLYFSAVTDATGGELFRTDGTPGGTTLVRDIAAGAGYSQIQSLTTVGNLVYFSATNGVDGSELWVSDGTAGGTVMVRDIANGSASSYPQGFAVMGGTLYFGATDLTHGSELWRSNGSLLTTVLVKNIAPGSGDGLLPGLRVVNGNLWFVGNDQGAAVDHGRELWRSNGTAGGTVLAADIRPGAEDGVAELLLGDSATVFFTGHDPDHGFELWAYTTKSSATKALPKSSYSKATASAMKIVVSVKVTASGTTPTGTVTIKRSGVVWGRATLVGGVAKVRLTKPLGLGSHGSFKAYYSGSVRARLSTSSLFKVVVS